MRSYEKANGPHLIAGSAFNIPAADNTYDQVMSHMLVNNLSLEDCIRYFREAIRVLKPGGKVRTAGVEPQRILDISGILRQEFGDRIAVKQILTRTAWSARDTQLSHSYYYLEIKKKK